jgi:ankyrin repeat protein
VNLRTRGAAGSDGGTKEDTALHYACSNHALADVALALAKEGSNVDIQGRHGNTALHLASIQGMTEVVLALVSSGVDVNLFNDLGENSLAKACQNGHTQLATALLMNRAYTEPDSLNATSRAIYRAAADAATNQVAASFKNGIVNDDEED